MATFMLSIFVEVVLNLNDINESYGNDELTQLDTPVEVTDGKFIMLTGTGSQGL